MDLQEKVCGFLETLGLTIDERKRNVVLATRRTALAQEQLRFIVADHQEAARTKRNSILILATGLNPPANPGGGRWFYFEDFLDQTIQADRIAVETADLSSYPDVRQQLSDVFIPQHITQSGLPRGQDAVSYFFDEWLPEETSRLLVILGPAGYGKTLLAAALAQRLARAHLASVRSPRPALPFLIPFGEFRRVAEFEGMILSSLHRRGVTDMTAGAFAYLVAENRVVLFLDGFDELLEERPVEARKNLRELIETLRGKGKVVITARSTFFRTSLDVADFLEHDLQSEDVTVIDLLPFDATQRGRVIAELCADQRTINRVTSAVESEGVREAMGSPLLLRETVQALVSGSATIGANPTRPELFSALETSVYKRERDRHSHRFSDKVQRSMLKVLAAELLRDNARGFDMDLVRVAALEATKDPETPDGELAKLADHHFLTADPEAADVRFNHQVFREYFQALALMEHVGGQDMRWIASVLNRRPLPEEVATFFAELAGDSLVQKLLDTLGVAEVASDLLLNNIGSVCAALNSRAVFAEFLQRTSPQNALSLRLVGFDLEGVDFSRRTLAGMEFTRCSLRDADFRSSVLQDIAFNECDLTGAEFEGAIGQMAVFDHGKRLFATLPILHQLESHGANCGRLADQAERLRDVRRDEVRAIVEARLRKFYVPGLTGPEGSKWDTSIQERNLLGGLDQATRRFVSSEVVPEMVSLRTLSKGREHGVVTYHILDAAKDDARALIEKGELVGLVEQLVARLL